MRRRPHQEPPRPRARRDQLDRARSPAAAGPSNPYGENGLNQEYPVVDPAVPRHRGRGHPRDLLDARVAQRSQVAALRAARRPGPATARRRGRQGDGQRRAGAIPSGATSARPSTAPACYFTRLTPFVSREGHRLPGLRRRPHAARGGGRRGVPAGRDRGVHRRGRQRLRCSSRCAPTSRTSRSAATTRSPARSWSSRSSGSAATRPRRRADDLTPIEKACRKTGRFAPGSSNFAGDGRRPGGLAGAVVVGVELAEPVRRSRSPSDCRRTPATSSTPRAPTGFYGSELLAQAALQWSPAYCLDKKRFKFQLNQMSDEAGWNLMEAGGGAAAEVSSEHTRGAPTRSATRRRRSPASRSAT